MGQHKKSKSWSTLISFPAMLTPSSSSTTRQSYQPTTTSSSNNAAENQDYQGTQQSSNLPSAISMKKSNSQQQYPAHSYGVSNNNNNYSDSKINHSPSNYITNNSSKNSTNNHNHNNNKSNSKNSNLDDGDLNHDMTLDSLPLFYLFSSDALADENAKEDTIIPFMEPPSLALDQATLIAGVLESLVRVVDDIPTGSLDNDSSSGNMTNDTENDEHDSDSDNGSDDSETNEGISDDMNGFDMGGRNGHPNTWTGSNTDNQNDMEFGSESSSPGNIQLSSSTSSSTKRSPYTIPSYTTDQQQQPLSRHAYPKPSTSTLSTLSSSTSEYTLRNCDHHRNHHYSSDLLACPFTIIGLGSFKVALWPSFSENQDLNLVILVSPTYPDHDIIENMYKMEKSLKQTLPSVLDTTIDAQFIGQHLIPLVSNSFTVE